MAFDYCQVVGTYNYESGAPAPGTVSFKPRYPLKDGTTTITAPIVFNVTNGVIPEGSKVPVTGRAGTTPTMAQYEVTETFNGVSNTYNLQLGRKDTRIDLGAYEIKEMFRPGTAALNVLSFGAKPDGDANVGTGTDNYAAFLAALLAAESRDCSVYVPPGEYRVTDTVPLPSRITLYGDGPAHVTIFQTTPGKPVIASKNWLTAYGGSPGGRATVRGITVVGEGTNAASHGIVLRDYYSRIENIVARACGGDGVRPTAFNQAGTRVGFTMVENTYTDILTDQCKGYGFNQDTDQPVLTDSFITRLVTRGVAGALGGIRIPFAAGWQVRAIHTYGSFAGPGVEMNRMWGSILDGAQIEQGWTGQGIRLANFQRAGMVDNIHIAMGATGTALECLRDTTLYPNAGPVIGTVSIVSSVVTTGTAVSWDTNSRPLYIGTLLVSGDNVTGMTLLGGFGAPSIRVVKDMRVLSTVRDSANSRSLAVNDIPVPLCDRAAWSANAQAQTVNLDIAGMSNNTVWEGIVSVTGTNNYSGGKACGWVAHVVVSSKATADPWYVTVTDIVPATGFDAAPTVAVTKGAPNGVLAVTFTKTTSLTYGVASLMSARD